MADNQTVIGVETRVSGEIRGDEDLVVKGRVDGKVQLQNALTVEKGAIVQADVDVKRLIVSGTLVGNVVASESIRLQASARVVGDLASPRVMMEAGAAYRGRVDMGDIEAARAAVASRPVSRPATSAAPARERPAPPRVAAAPSRMVAAVPARPAVKVAAPASSEKPAESAAPSVAPAFPRVAGAVGGAAPAWAKKKVVRRR
jgi:cytoskeletal protein CcmA (bactofilin family)